MRTVPSRPTSVVAVAVLAGAVASSLVFACSDRGRVESPPGSGGDLNPPQSATNPPREVEGRGVDAPAVIVTIDGVRWQEIFDGTDAKLANGAAPIPAEAIAPNLHQLGSVRGAFVGAPGLGTISASGPNYMSLPGYTEIFAGRPPVTCSDNACPRTELPTIFDEARSAGAKVAVFAAWAPLQLAATSAPGMFMVSCGRVDDRTIDPWPGEHDYRPDRLTSEKALAWFESEKPDVFFLGLGDPDEYAHRGDYGAYIESIRKADDTIGKLVAILDRQGDRGRNTTIMITADHGRAATFRHHGPMAEAARVWLVASGPRIQARGRVASPRERRLSDIAPTLRRLLGLAPDTSYAAGQTLDELF